MIYKVQMEAGFTAAAFPTSRVVVESHSIAVSHYILLRR